MVFNINAPDFVPSYHTIHNLHPYSPGGNGFIMKCSYHRGEVNDDDLFNTSLFPLTSQESLELQAVEEMNATLAELELLEQEQELHLKIAQKRQDLRDQEKIDKDIFNLMHKCNGFDDGGKRHSLKNMSKHMRIPASKPLHRLQQPR